MKKLKKFLVRVVALLLLAAGGGAYWLNSQLQPVNPADKPRLIRFEDSSGIVTALERLEAGKVIKSTLAARIYLKWEKGPSTVRVGTYKLGGNMSLREVVDALQKPIKRLVRLPETNWAARTANLLEKDQLGTAKEYMALVKSPGEFAKDFSFPFPSDSLEGYLYPDTYDLPPLMPAKAVVRRQLENFEKRVWEGLGKPKNLHRVIIIASMVEMEVARDEERPMVAAVIENRLKKGIRLQIDAAINYGIQKWRPLTYADYRNVDSPYNLYRVDGLPPGPICSPSIKSIRAALNPDTHKYLYYVALPSGRSLFAETYDQHLKNVAKRRAAIARGTPE
ncbi:MAG: endolytic transglycosylase MltG [Chlorobia bacterium]|nr:endolytic transglycosylase MltG [Fimbriimonadaceae bacterium]